MTYWTDDQVADAERYISGLEEAHERYVKEHCKKCDVCKEIIYDDDVNFQKIKGLHELTGVWVHMECVSDYEWEKWA